MSTQGYTDHSGDDAVAQDKQSPCLTEGTQAPGEASLSPKRRALLCLTHPTALRRTPEQIAHQRQLALQKRQAARAAFHARVEFRRFVAAECGARYLASVNDYDLRRAERTLPTRYPLTEQDIEIYRKEALRGLSNGALLPKVSSAYPESGVGYPKLGAGYQEEDKWP